MELIYTILFIVPTIWIGPYWLLMISEPTSERTKNWMRGNSLFIGPLAVWLITAILEPSGLIHGYQMDVEKGHGERNRSQQDTTNCLLRCDANAAGPSDACDPKPPG